MVFPVRIIMSPTSSRRFFVGRNARSAAPRTMVSVISPCGLAARAPARVPGRPGGKGMASTRGVPPGTRLPNAGATEGSRPGSAALLELRAMSATTGAAAVGLAGACALGLAACGGGARQDAGEPGGTFRLEVVDASFPPRQSVADAARLVIAVRNAGRRAAPDVAVTIATGRGSGDAQPAFATATRQPGVADPSRPVWVVDEGPVSGDTAYAGTWALGRL